MTYGLDTGGTLEGISKGSLLYINFSCMQEESTGYKRIDLKVLPLCFSVKSILDVCVTFAYLSQIFAQISSFPKRL